MCGNVCSHFHNETGIHRQFHEKKDSVGRTSMDTIHFIKVKEFLFCFIVWIKGEKKYVDGKFKIFYNPKWMVVCASSNQKTTI